ncbi:MAG: ABC transporter permease [Ruthenibacterium sp.]
MSFTVLQGAVEQGFLYGLVALGLYLSYRTLDIADLTTDSSFTLGCACSAVFTLMGHPVLGLVIAVLAGALAGSVTAVLQTKLGVQPILAGIITMTALYSVNLMVMGGKANLPMLKAKNVYTVFEGIFGSWGKLVGSALIVLVAGTLVALFLRTQLGLSLRATGDNRSMVSASSINPAFTTTVGLCLSNGLVALSGALIAQYQKFSDISLGTGMVVIGLASLIIGEVIVGRGGIVRGVAAALLGAVLYRIIIALALTSNVNASNLKLVSAVIVAAAISYPAIRERAVFYKLRKAGEKHAER